MKRFLVLLLILMFALAACGGGDDNDSGDSGDDQDTTSENTTDTSDETEEPQETEEPEEAFSVDLPEGYVDTERFLVAPFQNVLTGETYAIASFAGRPVFMQGMTIACNACLETQEIIRDEIIPALGTENFVFISYSTAVSDTSEELAAYAEENGFDWIFTSDSALFLPIRSEVAVGAGNGNGQPRLYVYPDGNLYSIRDALGQSSKFGAGPIDAENVISILNEIAAESGISSDEEPSDEEMSEATEEASDEEMTDESEATEEPSDEDEASDDEATEDEAEATEEA